MMSLGIGVPIGLYQVISSIQEKTNAKQRDYIEHQLPEGCVFYDLGGFGEIDQVVMVRCEDRITTSTIGLDVKKPGKSTVREHTVVIDIE